MPSHSNITNVGQYRSKTGCPRKIFRDIKKWQKSTKLILPKASFARVVHEILQAHGRDLRVTREGVEALQEVAEAYLCQQFERSQLCAQHAKRSTLMVKDMQFYARVSSDN